MKDGRYRGCERPYICYRDGDRKMHMAVNVPRQCPLIPQVKLICRQGKMLGMK
jgi:hypothetical protein